MPLRLPEHCHSIVRHGTVGLSVQASARQAAGGSRRSGSDTVESDGCGHGICGHGLLVARHARTRLCRHQHPFAVAFLAMVPFYPRHHIRSSAPNVPLLVQDSCHHHYDSCQQQCAQHLAGPLLHTTRHGQLQPGLSVEHQVLLARAEHGGASGAARACQSQR